MVGILFRGGKPAHLVGSEAFQLRAHLPSSIKDHLSHSGFLIPTRFGLLQMEPWRTLVTAAMVPPGMNHI